MDRTEKLRVEEAKLVMEAYWAGHDGTGTALKVILDKHMKLLKEHGMVFKSDKDGEPKDLHFVEELSLTEKE